MAENDNDNQGKQNHQETTPKDDSARKLSGMSIRRNDQQKVVDPETLIKETQTRVWGALKKGYEYVGSIDESDKFLRQHVFSKIDMMVLYVDLVGSTAMMLELPEEKLAIIISSFAQEMAAVIKQFDGYVLKFVGDAAIGYFIAEKSQLRIADNVVNCAKSMIAVIKKGINPILNQYDYPDLMVKIGIDFGKNIIVRYGANAEKSYVDLIGPPMNIAAKIQSFAKSDQILIGDDVYTRLHPSIQKSFTAVRWENDEWNYRSRVTGKIYQVYEYKN
ncbi:MAG: Adenylate/guanylate cyclase domain-containing protein [Nitrosopumilales archaeon]|nr:MAG: Adenylate/guanylate cyclase domain-containing protein [Nitrosopumilales archaeon]